jgi:hypothetical protein
MLSPLDSPQGIRTMPRPDDGQAKPTCAILAKMQQRSPTLEGFRAMLLRPSLGLAEIAWRWSLGAAACLLLAFSFFEYLDTLPVSRADLLLLGTGQPPLIVQAVTHIFRGSAGRVIDTAFILSVTLAIAWIIVATLARAATIQSFVAYFREENSPTLLHSKKNSRLSGLFILNVFRVVITFAAALGCLAAFLLGAAATPASNPSPSSAVMIFMTVALLVWLAWSTLNWLLSLAAIFVIADGQNTFGAIAAAVNLCRTRAGSVFAAGTWFSLAHITAFVVAGSLIAFPLSLASILPAGVAFGGVLLITLLYFAVADFLYAGRLAAYLAILEMPEPLPAPEPSTPQPDGGRFSALGIQPHALIDQNELILSDLPANS